jgi:putative nucleotidyltransferase with HDIG domain
MDISSADDVATGRFVVNYPGKEYDPVTELFKKIVLEDVEIPGVPDIALKVIEALEDEYCSVEKLEAIIMRDVSLTATILRIANSPAYGRRHEVARVSDAMLLIGLQNIVPFVCIAAVVNQHAEESDETAAVRHLLSVSHAASLLSGHIKTVEVKREMAAVAGLFHDVGKIIMCSGIPAEYRKIRATAGEQKTPLYQIETALLGFNHCLVGAALATKWNLPPPYREAIRRHHDEKVKKTGLRETDALCYVIRLADKMAFDSGAEPFVSGEKHFPELLEALGIDEQTYKRVAKKVREKGG